MDENMENEMEAGIVQSLGFGIPPQTTMEPGAKPVQEGSSLQRHTFRFHAKKLYGL